MGVSHVCIDPATTTENDPNNLYQDIRMCAPYHFIDLLDCENPTDLAQEELCGSLTERSQVRCEWGASLPEEVEGYTLDRIECIISIDPDVGYGRPPYNPDCNYSEA